MSNLFISRWQIAPEKREKFMAIFNEINDASKELVARETLCTFHGWGRDQNEFIVIEAWKDEAVVNGLRASPQFKEVFARMMECSSGPMKMELVRQPKDDDSIFSVHPTGKSTVHPDVGYGTVFL